MNPRNLFSFFFLITAHSFFSQSKKTEVNFHYGGKNLYLENYNYGGTGFCTDSVYLNGKRIPCETGSSAFEVPLSDQGIKWGDSINLTFFHKENCRPRILNEMHPYVNKVVFSDLKADAEGNLSFTATSDQVGVIAEFHVELYKWGAWRKVVDWNNPIKQLPGKTVSYKTKIPVYAGENKVRVIQNRFKPGSNVVSAPIVFFSEKLPITFKIDSAKKIISFSDSTDFMVEKIVVEKKSKGVRKDVLCLGTGRAFDFSPFKKHKLKVCYDNSMVVIDPFKEKD